MVLTKWSRYVGEADPSIPVFVKPDPPAIVGTDVTQSSSSSSSSPSLHSSASSLDLKASEEGEEENDAKPIEWDPIPDRHDDLKPEQSIARDERASEGDEATKDNVSNRLRSLMGRWF
jgi:hypothetical protein